MIQVKRAYDPPNSDDGTRFLVDRLWPRGVKKEDLLLEGWLKEVAPSDELRRWFGHDPLKWQDFQERYWAELEDKPEAWQPILDALDQGEVTLIYSARDTKHNNALALKTYIERHVAKN
jgi:uncharacterized protein YeaO (DUF488 family)